MTIDWQRVLPVLISMGIIVLVAILRQHSRTFATIAATMPINIPLALWISLGGEPDQANRISFVEGLALGMIPTFVFLAVAYVATRSGWDILPVIAVGYVGWGVCLGILLLVQALLKR